MTEFDPQRFVDAQLDGVERAGPAIPFETGLLNHVWRIPTGVGSIVVKYAPPHIATQPDVALAAERIDFETAALRAFSPGGRLQDLVEDEVRPPKLLTAAPEHSALAMEDVGPAPDLATWLESEASDRDAGGQRPREVGRQLGQFIARLHAETSVKTAFADEFFNEPIQRTRLEVQYRGVGEALEEAGIEDAAQLGRRAHRLGEKLCEPGSCLVMGDLWPPSVLVTDDGLRLIDWEFCTYGQPLQDTAHFWAHLVMLEHTRPEPVGERVRNLRDAFVEAYRETVPETVHAPSDAIDRHAGAIHAAAEVLARTAGAFRAGGPYDAAPRETIREAVRSAAEALRDPGSTQYVAAFHA